MPLNLRLTPIQPINQFSTNARPSDRETYTEAEIKIKGLQDIDSFLEFESRTKYTQVNKQCSMRGGLQ